MKVEKQIIKKYKIELTEQEAKDIIEIMKMHNSIYQSIFMDAYSEIGWNFEETIMQKVGDIGNMTAVEIINNLVL